MLTIRMIFNFLILFCLNNIIFINCYVDDDDYYYYDYFNKFKSSKPSFTIDKEAKTFLRDGKPFRYVSGSMHYFRIPEQYWLDRLQKARAGGLNAIQTYIEWSSHQPEPDIYEFNGNLNFSKYFELAKQADLLVIVRLGPFIASERDNMGLPYWLASKKHNITYRTSDETFMKYLKEWYRVMLPMLVPYLYQNGGPIIMAQLENEYGSFTKCDERYKVWLRDIVKRYLGDDLLLFTTDGSAESLLAKGVIDQVYPTVDFGAGGQVFQSFAIQDLYSDGGPWVNSEYYTGWYDVWGSNHSYIKNHTKFLATLQLMLSSNASVNFYMYHGGTTFGFMNGAIEYGKNLFAPMTTSYDYDAPIGEQGELTQKYYDIKKIIQMYMPDALQSSRNNNRLSSTTSMNQYIDSERRSRKKVKQFQKEPNNNQIITVEMEHSKDLFKLISEDDPDAIKPIKSRWPMTFEQLMLRHGYIYYEHKLQFQPSDPILLKINGKLHDRALVFVNGQYRMTLSRMDDIIQGPLSLVNSGSSIGLLVENQGHCCCSLKPDIKGIIGNVTLGKRILEQWNHYPLFKEWSKAIQTITNRMLQNRKYYRNDAILSKESNSNEYEVIPSFYMGIFNVTKLPENDLFLDVRPSSRKGVAFLNGFNLGRYWPVMGPQITLYVPKYLLKTNQSNHLILLEMESNRKSRFNVQLGEKHIINGTVPFSVYGQQRQILFDQSKKV